MILPILPANTPSTAPKQRGQDAPIDLSYLSHDLPGPIDRPRRALINSHLDFAGNNDRYSVAGSPVLCRLISANRCREAIVKHEGLVEEISVPLTKYEGFPPMKYQEARCFFWTNATAVHSSAAQSRFSLLNNHKRVNGALFTQCSPSEYRSGFLFVMFYSQATNHEGRVTVE